jgi:lipid II:glycine glycyltransferase (peptidoglycan interpeptide bridge formation enzyme)
MSELEKARLRIAEIEARINATQQRLNQAVFAREGVRAALRDGTATEAQRGNLAALDYEITTLDDTLMQEREKTGFFG